MASVLVFILPLSVFLIACLDAEAPAPPISEPGPASTGVSTLESVPRSTPPQTLPALPVPTPHSGNTPWVNLRMDAVVLLYNISGPGDSLLRSLDLRQMRGEPGFFGSYGFKEWTGVGEARPIGVMHELGHAYWGGFPVDGFPRLEWDVFSGEEFSPAMTQYHSDILTFMAQPPDGYEVFRQRMRDLPKLSQNNLEPLFHNLEADLVYGTGGSLALTPPILRKYWSRFLMPGAWDSWPQAITWFQSLDGDDREAAGKWVGFEHLDLRGYRTAVEDQGPPGIDPEIMASIGVEERQRLLDLADQFDLLLGGPQKEENFQFWRGYLRDKLRLHRNHPAYLQSLDHLPTAAKLAAAMDLIETLAGQSADQQAIMLETQMGERPFLVNFLPALDNKALLRLFANDPALPDGATLQATASFVERLRRFGAEVELVLASGASDPGAGGRELTAFLQRMASEPEEDVKLFMELLRDADHPQASQVVQTLSPDTIADLVKVAPFHLRSLLTPPQLLSKLNITAAEPTGQMEQGITLFLENPSGNFRVEEPFLAQMHQTVAELGETAPRSALRVIQETAYPLDGFIQEQPKAAVAILGSDIGAAARLVRDSDSVLSPPARIVYRLISADPVFAARMTAALYGITDDPSDGSDESGFDEAGSDEAGPAVESLAYFAYDRVRRDRWPGLGISLEQDGLYLQALWQLKSGDWLEERLAVVLKIYKQRTSAGEVAPDFIAEYQATWDAAVSTLPRSPAREELSQMFSRVAQDHGSGP